MITSLSIQRLRGIRQGTLTGLTPLVVLVGRNGSGKTTVIDAIYLATSRSPSEALVRVVGRRRELSGAARWLLWRAGDEGHAQIQLTRNDGLPRAVTLGWSGTANGGTIEMVMGADSSKVEAHGSANYLNTSLQGHVDHKFPSTLLQFPDVRLVEFQPDGHAPLHALYTEAVRVGRRGEVRQMLAAVVPGLEDIQILTEGDQPVVHLVFPWGSVPVALAGDGILSLVISCLEMAARPGGVVLFEEPEVYQHPAALRQTARALLAAARRGVQVILSTHSLDLIDHLINESTDADLDRLSLFRLLLDAQGELRSTRVAGPDMALARHDIGDDLR